MQKELEHAAESADTNNIRQQDEMEKLKQLLRNKDEVNFYLLWYVRFYLEEINEREKRIYKYWL